MEESEACIIDVRGDDGLLRQGTLVDCAPGGLMIDWECVGGPSAHFVPFGKMYLGSQREFTLNSLRRGAAEGKEFPVEVLVRRSTKDPRTWYPGTLLVGEFSSSTAFAFVAAALPGGEEIVIVPGQRVRASATEDQLETLRVKKKRFVKDSVRLPENFSYVGCSAQGILDALNRISEFNEDSDSIYRTDTFTKAIKLNKKSLHFIRMGCGIIHKNRQNQSPDMWDFLLRKAASDCGKTERQQRKRKRSDTDLQPLANQVTGAELISASAYGIQILPKDILACTFQHLDSVDQCRLRRVCAYWNGILTSRCVTSVLRVRYTYNEKSQDYMSVASLHYGWTVHTKTIVNAGMHAGYPLFCGGRLFRTLVRRGLHAPVQTIIMADVVWTIQSREPSPFVDLLGRFVDELNGIAAVCQMLLLHNVKLDGRVLCSLPMVTFAVLSGRIAGCVTVEQLWSRIDDGLPVLDDTQEKQVYDWIAARDRSDQKLIVTVLNNMQSSDPREDTHYRSRVWTAADVATLELHKLSKLTLYSLAAVSNWTEITIPLSWKRIVDCVVW